MIDFSRTLWVPQYFLYDSGETTGLAPHAKTTRFTYTPPSANLTSTFLVNTFIKLIRMTAGTTPKIVQGQIGTGITGGIVAKPHAFSEFISNTVGSSDYDRIGNTIPFKVLASTDSVMAETEDVSVGGTNRFTMAILIAESSLS